MRQDRGKSRGRVIAWVERFVSAPGEAEETRHRKGQFVIASTLVVPAGILWGILYFGFGEHAAAAFPWAYSVLTFVDLLLFLRLRHFGALRYTQQALLLVLPIALHIALGGFVGSGLVILWAFLAVLMALLFGSGREAKWWFTAFGLAILGGAWAQPALAAHNRLPSSLVLVFFILNVGAVSSIAFVVLYSFVSDRRRLRELEVAYVNQELMLRQSEKLATLGTLAAGVAHELNNPASAAQRAAGQLRIAIAQLEEAHLRLGAADITPRGVEALRAAERSADASSATVAQLEPLSRSDAEAAVEEWLEEHSVANAWELAPALTARGLDRRALSGLEGLLEGEALAAGLTWLAAAGRAHSLVREIGDCSTRVSEIVGALKGYTHLGQAPLQSVNLHEEIDNTLVILRHTLHTLHPGISVHRHYGADVPTIQAYGLELNQVWTNLLGNAVDAVGDRGEITIGTRRDGDWVEVTIEDTGPGIPDEIAPRVFDPFFTTKAPGKGTGLGLSISHSIVTQKHGGELRLDSRPGCTRFTVRLPLAPRKHLGA